MSATATETNSPPQITVLTRVASIPMISSSWGLVNDTLSSNAYTRSPYFHAKGLSTSAYKLTEPIQVKLAPLIVRADSIANKAVDVVESRNPYPFKVQPEEVANYVRERKQSTIDNVNERVNNVHKVIDDKVKAPALHVAQDIDQRFAPIVNYIEGAVGRFGTSEAGPSTPSDAYQYQRALALSKTLSGNLYEYSAEQLKHIQAQSALAQKASETASSISAVATSSVSSAQSRIHALSDNLLAELQKLHNSSISLSASLQSSLHDSAAQIQSQIPQIQQSYADLTGALSSTVNELTTIVTTKNMSLQDKVTRVSKEVQHRVTPLLEAVQRAVSQVLSRTETKVNGVTPKNGSAR
ncbi:hypothetical protein M413DRAFT_8690 [Hebeloma cylindrosporum]|uniref:Lipid droplet-associated perilipin protein n=1 Tax=Hebeloma cylindrosporum TaxID=76867 RepID=A0A0C3CNX7_HEBCY|nr:hypothetical protein M413DRAFT_8690 [Hebeloma cylindrosporum h7]